MRAVLIPVVLVLLSAAAYSDTLDVPAGYPTIQAAINDASNGDVVSVAPGTYPEILDFLGKAITVRSSDGAEFTVIDGQQTGPGVSFINGEGSDSVLDGFNITNCFGDFGGGIYCYMASPTFRNNIIGGNGVYHDGGGIYGYNSNAVVQDNQFTNNLSANGGGVFFTGTSMPTIERNTFTGNGADVLYGFGGGICCDCDTATIANNTLTGNEGAGGGGIYCTGTLTDITDNEISGNSGVAGGGIYCEYYASPTITGNTLDENTAIEGGGIFCYYSTALIDNNSINNNSVTAGGGGICCYDRPAEITNNTIMGNTAGWGGGIDCIDCSPVLAYNTIKENSVVEDGGGIYCTTPASFTMEGNTITDNSVSFEEGSGGGVYCFCESADLSGNTIRGNSAGSGGGVYCYVDSATLSENRIEANSAETGGGIYMYATGASTLSENEIRTNTSDVGGGAYIECLSATFIGNEVFNNTTTADGGGLYVLCEEANIKSNILKGNAAVNGGGLYCTNTVADLISNVVSDNSATGGEGGGICLIFDTVDLQNNIIAHNTAVEGAGISFDTCNISLANNTIGGNEADENGGGIYCFGSTADALNMIFWGNTAETTGNQIWIGPEEKPSTLTIDFSTVEGGKGKVEVATDSTLEWGEDMSVTDPDFVDEDDYDYHITYDSPCRDTGVGNATNEAYDFEGDPRETFGLIDIGADEFHTRFYCTGDFTPGGAVKGKLIGLPDTTPTGIFFGSGLYETPLHTKWGDYYLEAPWLVVALGAIPSNGAMIIGSVNLPASPSAPYDVFMQGLIGLDSDSFTNTFVMKVR